MTITAEQTYLLNNKMGRVASNVQLGTLIANAESVVASEIALAEGKLLVGNSSGVAAASTLTSGQLLVGNGSSVATPVSVTGDVTISASGVTAIASGIIVNADVSGSAAVDFSKLAALTSGNILVGSAGNVATSVAMSGDATIVASGALTIANSAVTNAKVHASAAIDFSKLATLTSTNILVGSSGNVATSVAMTGDVTISNTGVTAIGANKVTVSMQHQAVMKEATGTLTQANLVALSTPLQLIAAAGSGTIIIVDEIEMFHDYATAAYTSGSDLAIEYETSGTNIALFADTLVTGVADQNAIAKPSTYDLDGATGSGVGFDVTSNANKGIFATSTNFADGNASNIVKWRIRYHVVTLIT